MNKIIAGMFFVVIVLGVIAFRLGVSYEGSNITRFCIENSGTIGWQAK